MITQFKFDNKKILSRSPRLDTVIMVEKFIEKTSGEFKKTTLFNNLPKKVMWGTYNIILEYLWENNKIALDNEGNVIYIWSPEAGKKFNKRKRIKL